MELLPHQIKALERLEQSGGRQLLNLAPGAGKTLTSLTYIKDRQNVIVICPSSIKGVWEAEAIKWGFPEFVRFDGTPKQRNFIYDTWVKSLDAGWMVIGYEMFLREHKRLAKIKWDVIIADESQKVKSPTAKVSKVFRAFAQNVPECILLSGTPIVNSWMDIWNQVESIKPGSLYGNWYTFRAIHAIMPVRDIPMITGWKLTDVIKERIKPYIFTVPKEVIQQNLPPVSTVDIPVDLSKQERDAYKKAKEEFLIELENGEDMTIANALVKVARLRQIANGLYVFGFEISSKCEALLDILDTLTGEKVIIFSMYAQTIKYLQQQLHCKHVITGETQDRDRIIEDWRKNGTVLLGTQAISSGLNLQDAHYVIQFEPPWTRAEEDQRIARSWRTGQKNPVTVYNLLAQDTVDYGVRKLIARKGATADEMSAYTMGDIREMI